MSRLIRHRRHDDADDSDDEWISGGKYVPPQPAPRPPTLSPHTPSASSLWDAMSPAPLPTPLPDDDDVTKNGNAVDANDVTPASDCHDGLNRNKLLLARTPVTARLQRLWRSIPGTVAKSNSGGKHHLAADDRVNSSSSRNSTTRNDIYANASSSSSNLTPFASFNGKNSPVIHNVQSTATQISNEPPNNAMSTSANYAQETPFQSLLAQMTDVTTKLTTQFPTSTASMGVWTEPLRRTVVHVVDLTLPLLFWLVKTGLAFVIMTVGTLMLWILALAFGRDRMVTLAEQNLHIDNNLRSGDGRRSTKGHGGTVDARSGDDESAGMRFLRESIAKSPFLKRERHHAVDADPDASSPSLSERLNKMNGRESSIPRRSNVVASPEASAPSSRLLSESAKSSTATAATKSTSTPPISAMRNRNSSISVKATPHPANSDPTTSNSKHTPQTANTRRVLFSEKNGKVSTEQFHYDKNLPASARKIGKNADQRVVDDKENRVETVNAAKDVGPTSLSQKFDASSRISADSAASRNEAPSNSGNARSSTLASSMDDSILRPSTYSGSKSEAANPLHDGGSNTIANRREQVAPHNSAQKREQQEQDEKRKQQYIQRHGLNPAITPLSRRYGRFKRQQIMKPLALTSGSSSRNNPNKGNNTASISSKLTSMEDAMKRKRKNLLGAASRIGRQSRARMSGISAVPIRVLGRNQTPMKRRRDITDDYAEEWVWRAMNDDGTTEIGIGSSKKGKFSSGGSNNNSTSTTSMFTPSKSPMPSVTTPPKNGTTAAAFAFGNATPAPKKTDDEPASKAPVDATPAKTPGLSFSFGSTTATPTKPLSSDKSEAGGTTSNNSGTATGSSAFSFGEDKSKVSAPSFSFGTDSKTSATTAPSVSFGGSVPAAGPTKENETKPSNATTAPAPSVGAGFVFGGSAASTAPPAADAKPSATANAFGNTDTPAATAAPATSGFTFGASSGAETQPSTATAPAPTTATFSFGSTATTTSAPASTSSAAARFSFGADSGSSSAPGQSSSVSNNPATGTAPSAPTPAAASLSFGANAPTNSTPAATGFTFGGNTGAVSAPAPANAASGLMFGNAASATIISGGAPTGTASTFSFGAGVTTAVPNFSVPTGGGVTSSSGGASARRRAQKASGRRK
mmetsp:Transcript_19960/g.39523  ORF Transcript_19960/g.39523 Transcript_19960/m.39523 type:complete len:1146 (+) Transcript_19960:170-3607(+)|eukprot:CAMPEP_0171444114 /NCGR_PEP_ID=MMETSP0881-20121228/32676_1 /TAXON_ID=67004 /ORGANISM="Thalassiosira weissflogii, Strain CCMP1336" /LENGTH=1145 /DNA_ID=CAMNT_0011967731 /DNA_START=87 /DNA_END=3524 /DNA_ORIENTATION=+